MRMESVMLSTRISQRAFDELKRIEKLLVFYTRSKLVKEALELLSAKYPDEVVAKTEFPLLPNGKPDFCSLLEKKPAKKKPASKSEKKRK